VNWTILLGEVLSVRFDEFASHMHSLVHLLQSVATILVHPCFLGSLYLLGTVGVATMLLALLCLLTMEVGSRALSMLRMVHGI
jgi:hypothetical protein